MIYWHIIRPFVVLLVNTSDYTCSSFDKAAITIFSIIYDIAYPLTPQIIFIGLIWQMSRI